MKKYIQEHKYVLLVLYLPIYLIWFALVERMVPSTEGCFVSYLPLDDKIPFLPGFILAYVLWYPFLIVPVVVTLLKDDRRAFIRYAAFIIAGFSISLTICMIWPNWPKRLVSGHFLSCHGCGTAASASGVTLPM